VLQLKIKFGKNVNDLIYAKHFVELVWNDRYGREMVLLLLKWFYFRTMCVISVIVQSHLLSVITSQLNLLKRKEDIQNKNIFFAINIAWAIIRHNNWRNLKETY